MKDKAPFIFVIGNEKGGAGKTTCAIHLIVSLLEAGYRVTSIDTDSRQHSLTNYINNRVAYNTRNPDHKVKIPKHFHIIESNHSNIADKEEDEKDRFSQVLDEALNDSDFIVIDTPGSYTFLSKLAHSYADTIITPINDSFFDVDVMATINPEDFSVVSPSIYSQMIWEQKMQRIKRDKKTIEWVVMRNRLSNLDAVNKRNVGKVLEALSKRISFKVVSGFSERVIFKELFLQGLTLLDLTKANHGRTFSISHVAARQELRNFLNNFGINIA